MTVGGLWQPAVNRTASSARAAHARPEGSSGLTGSPRRVARACAALDALTQAHDRAVDDLPDQLAAGGIDILAARAPHGGHDPAAQQLVAEPLDGRIGSSAGTACRETD